MQVFKRVLDLTCQGGGGHLMLQLASKSWHFISSVKWLEKRAKCDPNNVKTAIFWR